MECVSHSLYTFQISSTKKDSQPDRSFHAVTTRYTMSGVNFFIDEAK